MDSFFVISYVALWILFLIIALVLISILRNLGVIFESLSNVSANGNLVAAPTNLKAGDILPEVDIVNLLGEKTSIFQFQGEKTAFSIINPNCSACHQLLKHIQIGDEDQPDPLDSTLKKRVVVCIGNIEESKALLNSHHIENILPVFLDPKDSITNSWGISAFPATIITDHELRVVRQSFAG